MSQKRANTLPLVAILCLALVLIGATALFIWLKNNEEKGTMALMGHKEIPPQFDGRTTTTQMETTTRAATTTADESKNERAEKGTTETKATSAGHNEESTTTAPGSSSATTKQSSTVTASHSEAETAMDDNIRFQSANAPYCKEWPTGWADECSAEEGFIASPERRDHVETAAKEMDPIDWLRPMEYSLNLSLFSEDAQSPSFGLQMQLSILVELRRESSVIALHCGPEVDILEEVRIWSCSAEAFVCVRSMSRVPYSSLLLLHLVRPLSAASVVRLQFPLIRVSLSLPNEALFVHIPSPWERHRPWMIGSQFPLAGGVRTLFPSVDSLSGRAVLRLCLTHSKQTVARSNSPLAHLREGSLSGMSVSCFRDSPALPPSQFAFLLFRNLRPVTSAQLLTSPSQPHIELFIGAHLNPTEYGWAIDESRKTIERMRQMTAIEYPLEKLTLMSSPLQTGNDAMGGLGLVHIRDSWMEYPKFVHTHELLIGQLMRQWTVNVLSLCDQCIQNGLGLFLEWKVSSEQFGTEPKAEFDRRFWEARERLMGGSVMTKGSLGCAERVAVVVHMLERSFGARYISNFLGRLFRQFGWPSRCTSTTELSELFLNSTDMPEAQRVFDSFLLRPSSSEHSQIPLVHIAVLPDQSLLRLSQFPSANDSSPLSIPVEIVDDTLRGVRLVLNNSQDVPFIASSFAVAQPNTFARFVYNADNYAKLGKCIGHRQRHAADGCPALSDAMLKSVWDDLCWALFNGRLNPTNDQRPLAEAPPSDGWPSLFRALTAQGAVSGDCACCMKTAEEALLGPCRWTWLDRCARIDMPKR